jgi:hypothetical protein
MESGGISEEPTGFAAGGGIGKTSAPCPPTTPGTKINIQISGSDMAASSGVFAETVGGPSDEEGGATDDDEEGVGGTGTGTKKAKKAKKAKAPKKAKKAKKAKAPKKAKAKANKVKAAPKRKSKFALEGAPITSGDDIAWALVGFILVAILILM